MSKAKNDFIPPLTGAKFSGGGADGTYRGAYSALKADRTFSGKPASRGSYESSGVVSSGAKVPPVGEVDDGRDS
jgi:hypothetical protein